MLTHFHILMCGSVSLLERRHLQEWAPPVTPFCLVLEGGHPQHRRVCGGARSPKLPAFRLPPPGTSVTVPTTSKGSLSVRSWYDLRRRHPPTHHAPWTSSTSVSYPRGVLFKSCSSMAASCLVLNSAMPWKQRMWPPCFYRWVCPTSSTAWSGSSVPSWVSVDNQQCCHEPWSGTCDEPSWPAPFCLWLWRIPGSASHWSMEWSLHIPVRTKATFYFRFGFRWEIKWLRYGDYLSCINSKTAALCQFCWTLFTTWQYLHSSSLLPRRGFAWSVFGAEWTRHRGCAGWHGIKSQVGNYPDCVRGGSDGLQRWLSWQSEPRVHDGCVQPRGPGPGTEHPRSTGRQDSLWIIKGYFVVAEYSQQLLSNTAKKNWSIIDNDQLMAL